MGYSAQAVANHFLSMADSENEEITPLKIQKLVYIAHGWYLAVTKGQPLVDDEYVEAWQYGPVFPSLYHEFAEFGKSPITARRALDWEFDGTTERWINWVAYIPKQDSYEQEFIEHIWNMYKKFSPGQLSTMTHEEGTPWSKILDRGTMKNAHIENSAIREYYEGKLR